MVFLNLLKRRKSLSQYYKKAKTEILKYKYVSIISNLQKYLRFIKPLFYFIGKTLLHKSVKVSSFPMKQSTLLFLFNVIKML